MEFQAFPYSIIITIFLLILTALKIHSRSEARSPSMSKLPPGPWKLPLIGNLHLLFGSLPNRGLHRLAQKHGPLMRLQLGEVPHVVVSSAEMAKEVMKTHDLTFATRPLILAPKVISYGCTDIAFAPYGEYWRQLRKICTLELLSTKRVQSFRHIREEGYSNLIKLAASNAGSPVNLTENICSSTYVVTSRAAFGNQCKEQEELIEVIREALRLASGFDVGDVFPSLKLLHLFCGSRATLEKLHKQADRIMDNIIEEHRERKKTKRSDGVAPIDDDLADVLLGYADGGSPEFSLSTDNIKAVILDVFGGGSETSATTVDWAMAELIKNPKILEEAQSEVREVFDKEGKVDETGLTKLKYLKLVIKETFRMHPPLPLLLPRECGQKCEINGYEIPMKTKVIVNAWAIGRDPKYWNDPETFYPERFVNSSVDFKGINFELIPFGAGRRMCPGMSFGLANVELPLAMLLYHFDWELPNGMKNEDMDMTESLGVTQRRKEDLYLIPKTHQRSFLATVK